jgi:hypothetical protein
MIDINKVNFKFTFNKICQNCFDVFKTDTVEQKLCPDCINDLIEAGNEIWIELNSNGMGWYETEQLKKHYITMEKRKVVVP